MTRDWDDLQELMDKERLLGFALQSKRETGAALSRRRQDMRAEIESLESEVGSLRKTLFNLKHEAKVVLLDEYYDIKATLESHEKTLGGFRQEVTEIKKRCKELDRECVDLDKNLKDVQRVLATYGQIVQLKK